MDSYIIHETAQEVIDLLQRVDDGYILTGREQRNLNRITVANFSKLKLEKLPESISSLSQLTQLDVSDNKLTNLPESIGMLSQLAQLNVSNNELTSLPESISALSRLTKLIVFRNQLTSLPENIGALPQLTELDVSSNQLTSLPKSIVDLSQLTEFSVSNNQLVRLPENIGTLSQLTHFSVSNNQLTSLPESIGDLSRLKTLWAFTNQLTNLPESIGNLSQLEKLDISNNHLISLPESVGALSQLTQFNVSRNQLTSLPESIRNLSQLVELDICELRLQKVPYGIQQLSKLEYLDLSANPLKILPDWLGDMTKLRSLILSSLQLTAIPYALLKRNIPFLANQGIWRRENCMGIAINDTTLSIQPISLFDQSRDKSSKFRESRKLIEDYFTKPKVPVGEAKVIFLGDGGAGKTYTIQRLLNGCRKGDYPTKETHGILIENLYATKDEKTYTIRVWDFGGQDIMHEMHRCFLTDRTCYVIMIDTRSDNQTIRARHWMRIVQSIAPKSPVLLLVNQISGNKNLNLDYNRLEQEFPNLINVEYCSSMDANDEEFRQKVEQTIFQQALDMDSCKMEFPESWENIRRNLLNLQKGTGTEQKKMYYIDRRTFHNLCDHYAIPADNGLRAWLLTWFNDLGVCFSYHLGENGQERSIDYKILDPMWLTSAVYKIIWEKEQTDDGLIAKSEIYRILEKPGSAAMKKDGIPCLENVSYSKQECDYVLDIMRMFRISYPANENTEFIPALCKPNSKLEPTPKRWKQHIAYQFRYTSLPETVLHRLMISCFNNLQRGKRWRKGFWLECGSQGLSAVIRVDAERTSGEEDTLQIDIYAQTEIYKPWIWLQSLRLQIIEINNALSLQAKDFVLVENNDAKEWFSLKKIWNCENRKESNLQGEENLFPIQPLLELIYGESLPDEKKKRMEEQNEPWMNPSTAFSQKSIGKNTEQMKDALDKPLVALNELLETQSETMINIQNELKRSNDLREREISAREENAWTLQQLNELLCAIRDGKIEVSSQIMYELVKMFQQSDQPTLYDMGQKMRWQLPRNKIQLLREFLGDASNLTTLTLALVEYGPALIKIIPRLATPIFL